MMTPQEVANCTFAKSMMGGYNMASVDDFLDKLTEDYTTLFKENAALKAKLKVTVDKMAEYREAEDAIRTTLLTAQKMATAMVTEAEQKRDALILDASKGAKARLAELRQEVAAEERRLEECRARVNQELELERQRLAVGQERLRAFIQEVSSVCNEQLAMLELLPELPPAPAAAPTPPAPVPAPAPAAAEQQPAPAAEEPAPEQPEPKEEDDDDREAAEVRRNLKNVLSSFPSAKETMPAVVGDPFSEESAPSGSEGLESTKVLNLEDLQFGRNYMRD